ncbi:MAG: DeoR/GlpR transcriptional regulator, partial [Clostridiales bacterium]|nr:DeoR/GlpR transcriptional regulator [Clostridiales bacterium]
KIGKEAAKRVRNGETVILDASTSALYVAKHLKNKQGITVITNAERIILELADCRDINLICTGGVLRHASLSYTGRAAENVIGSYLADHLFFSCKGFSPQTGLMDSTEPESEMRKIMITRAKHRTFLCDKTKFDRVGFSATAKLEDIDTIITDEVLPQGWEEEIRKQDVEIIIAK